VSRIVPADKLLDEALAAAAAICALSGPSVALAKECVNRAFEGGLVRRRDYERRCSIRCLPPRTRRKAWTPS
jgi:enoyl-CoA hydratase